ncbi:MAG: hypothetical protein COA62_07640 [Rhodobiaceae bacterium]|nr:MAG: hypothetical protein COA62_07640 [Rhodobiaceae bacterium]
MNRTAFLAALICVVGLLVGYGIVLPVRLIPNIETSTLVTLLFSLIAVALFIERAAEVYLGTWRRAGRAERLRALRESNGQVKETTAALNRLATDTNADKSEIGAYMAALVTQKGLASEAAGQLATYRAGTAQLALTTNVAFGVLIACLGVRALEPLFNWSAVAAPSSVPMFFTFADILITGALLGGGADGLHKIVSVFTAYADETKDKVQNATAAD